MISRFIRKSIIINAVGFDSLEEIKGAVARDYRLPFFCLKHSSRAPYKQAKTVSRTCSFLRRFSITMFEICVSTESTLRKQAIPNLPFLCHWLCKHKQVLFA